MPNFVLEWHVGFHGHDEIRVVTDLISNGDRQWNVGLIQDLFMEDTAEAILRLPTLIPLVEDHWVWTKEPSGAFSVKSFLMEEQERRAPSLLILDKKNLGVSFGSLKSKTVSN